ncbi:hypothetical protein [Bradyrhizobium sp. UFLA05-112]
MRGSMTRPSQNAKNHCQTSYLPASSRRSSKSTTQSFVIRSLRAQVEQLKAQVRGNAGPCGAAAPTAPAVADPASESNEPDKPALPTVADPVLPRNVTLLTSSAAEFYRLDENFRAAAEAYKRGDLSGRQLYWFVAERDRREREGR